MRWIDDSRGKMKTELPSHARHALRIIRSMGPVSIKSIVSYLNEQWVKDDGSIPSQPECFDATVDAINVLMRDGSIELYETGDAYSFRGF